MSDISTTCIYSNGNSKDMKLNAYVCVSIRCLFIRIRKSVSVCLFRTLAHTETHNIQIGRQAEADKIIVFGRR